jgi:hypothetical protein
MQYLIGLLILSIQAFAVDKTFEELVATFPLGTQKQEILRVAPSAIVVPSKIAPLDSSAQTESIVLSDNPINGVVQLHLVNGRIAAMFFGKAIKPGASPVSEELNFILTKKELSEFTVLRANKKLEPLDVRVKRFSMGKPNQIALSVASPLGPELWVIDENIFHTMAFFMEPTDANRAKLLKSKQSIDQQLKK